MSGVDAGRASGSSPAPAFAGGKITFYCPNGHRLIVSAIHAGKRGKCDRAGCGVAVTIPVPSAGLVSDSATPEVDLIPADPVELAPIEPEVSMPPVPAAPGPVAVPAISSATQGNPAKEAEPAAVGSNSGGWELIAAQSEPAPPPATVASAPAEPDSRLDNPTARLLAQLWKERDHGGVVELHLVGGSVILPEWYEPTWSGGSHGLFARQETDGTVTITAVAWETVQRVVVRQVQGLPDSMAFE